MATSLVSTGVQFPDATIQTTAASGGASGGTTASGNVTLTSSSAGAQYVTPTSAGQSVTLPNATTMSKGGLLFVIYNNSAYDLKIRNAAGTTKGFIQGFQTATVGLADNSTSAGTWILGNTVLYGIAGQVGIAAVTNNPAIQQIITVDSTRNLYLIYTTANFYGIILNTATGAWGSLTLIRATNATGIASAKVDTDKVIVVTGNGVNAVEGVVLSLSGTTITVGTAATNSFSFGTTPLTTRNIAVLSTTQVVIQAGAGYFACSISGTTVTVGNVNNPGFPGTPLQLFDTGTSTAIALWNNVSGNSELFLAGVTASGASAQVSSSSSITNVPGTTSNYVGYAMVGSRLAIYSYQSGSQMLAYVVSTSGSGISLSSGVSFGSSSTFGGGNATKLLVAGTRFLMLNYGSTTNATLYSVNCSTGTPSADTARTITVAAGSTTGTFLWNSGTNQVSIMLLANSSYSIFNTDVSSGPTVPVYAYSYMQANTIVSTQPLVSTLNSLALPQAIVNSTSVVFNTPTYATASAGTVIFTGNGAYVVPTIPNTTTVNAATVVDPTGKTAGQLSQVTGVTSRQLLQVFELAQ